MSDDEKNTVKALFAVDRAKAGRANCKGCKQKCLQGELRLAKVVPSPYGDGNTMKSWHHVDCFMNVLLKQRPTTKRIDSIQDIENFSNLSVEDKQTIIDKINEMEKDYAQKHNNKFPQRVLAMIDVNENQSKQSNSKNVPSSSKDVPSSSKNVPSSSKNVLKVTAINIDLDHKDNYFKQFRKLCADISNEDAYTAKTAVVNNFFTNGSDGNGFKSDVILWCRFLLPQAVKRVYNLKSKQLIKLFARIFHADHDDMLTDLENGDVAETIRIFFEKSRHCTPSKKSLLKIQEVDAFLEKLSELTKEDEQIYHFKGVVKQCTSNDLKMIIRLINGDLRINSGPKHILEGIHPDAYKVFQTSRDIDSVIDRVLSGTNIVKGTTDSQKSTFKAKLVLMTPVLPMLAQACKSVDMAMKKCPNGMYSEIKYDGERVQVHKKGLDFKYFSRALKPVLPHKVSRFKDFIPKAFPHGQDLILDAEVLMIDTQTGKPLPFGSLGKHKKAEFEFAEVCLFVFDCIYFNGEVLLDKPIRERREILQKNMIEIENHIMFSEMKHIEKPSDLANMIAKVLKLGLEGLVLKDLESTYEPGKRHWLKVKKDYLFGGAMADSADLVVLGAWFGTGKKGGLLSVFLMGCYDEHRDKWLTVTKVHTGHDDKSLEELQEPLKGSMEKISQDSNKVPAWMNCTNVMVPDFIAKNPRKMPVWEITGTELTKANLHTADGLSVRFPRVTRIRDDKDWKTATNLGELKLLYKTSKENVDVSLLNNLANKAEDVEQLAKIDLKEIDLSNKASPSKANSVRKDKIENYFNKNDTNVDSKHTKHDRDINIDKKYNEDNNISCNNWSPTDSKTKLGKRIAESDSLDGSPKKCKDIAKSGVKKHSGPLNPLPDYFVGYNLAFHQEDSAYRKSEKVRTAIRYWIAFGGKVINHGDNVTHVIHFDSNLSFRDFNEIQTKYSFGARHVNLKWLTESIKRRCLCDTRQYAVTLDS